jgi:hypothetical protein
MYIAKYCTSIMNFLVQILVIQDANLVPHMTIIIYVYVQLESCNADNLSIGYDICIP